jgi:hypothetical protein
MDRFPSREYERRSSHGNAEAHFLEKSAAVVLNQLEGDAATLAKSKLGINRSDTELFNGFTHAYVSAVLSYHWGSVLTKHMGDNREDGAFAAYTTWGQWGDKGPKGRYLYQDGFYNRRRPHSSLDGMTPDQAYYGAHRLPPVRLAA